MNLPSIHSKSGAPASACGDHPLSMTSLEIAELVGSRHDKVKQSIYRLVNRGVIQHPPMGEVENSQSLSPNKTSSVFIFTGEKGKRDSIVVMAQMSPEFTARLVDRWQELEAAIASPRNRILEPYYKAAIATFEEMVTDGHSLKLATVTAFRVAAAVAQDALPAIANTGLSDDSQRILPTRIATPLNEGDLIAMIENMKEGEVVSISDPSEMGFTSIEAMRRVLTAYHRRVKCKIGWISSGSDIRIERRSRL